MKTVGDAVMASFDSPASAVSAMVRGLKSLRQYNAETVERQRNDGIVDKKLDATVHIRVGIHAGTAAVVPLNGINDYFGQTVNTAARIEGKCQKDELLVTEAIFDDADAAETIAELKREGVIDVVEEPLVLELKGVEHPVKAYRLQIM